MVYYYPPAHPAAHLRFLFSVILPIFDVDGAAAAAASFTTVAGAAAAPLSLLSPDNTAFSSQALQLNSQVPLVRPRQ